MLAPVPLGDKYASNTDFKFMPPARAHPSAVRTLPPPAVHMGGPPPAAVRTPPPPMRTPPPTMRTVPPPPRRRTEVLPLTKREGVPLGVRFHSQQGDDGAELQCIEPYGTAWRHGLRWGDVICQVRLVATGQEWQLSSGEDAAHVLRPAIGRLELTIRRRTITPEDRAAMVIQSHLLGVHCRKTIRLRHASATVITASWRRWCAVMDARALRLDAIEDRAVETIQGAWRTRIRRWERRLAIEYLQERTRAFVAELRTGKRARKRRCIRAPPTLFDDL